MSLNHLILSAKSCLWFRH